MLSLKAPEELIEQMKTRNIKFDLMNEQDAISFLEKSTYYKKVSSYKNNFLYAIKDGHKSYYDLDFAYLRELSTIDMHLRKVIIHACLNIEHSVKLRIINACQRNNYNGYEIADEFLSTYPNVRNNVHQNAANSYCSDLITNYTNRIPIWIFVEVISFGDLCKLFKFLTDKDIFGDHTKSQQTDNVSILYAVHHLRNAAAHNHCILRDLRYQKNVTAIHEISTFVSRVSEINNDPRRKALTTKVYNDFICLLYAVYNFIDSEGVRNGTVNEIKDIFTDRMLKNKHYFTHCIPVKNAYTFIKKILDFYFP